MCYAWLLCYCQTAMFFMIILVKLELSNKVFLTSIYQHNAIKRQLQYIITVEYVL